MDSLHRRFALIEERVLAAWNKWRREQAFTSAGSQNLARNLAVTAGKQR